MISGKTSASIEKQLIINEIILNRHKDSAIAVKNIMRYNPILYTKNILIEYPYGT